MLAHHLDEKYRTQDVLLTENVSFETLLLSENVIKGLAKNGFKKPSPIQLKAIPLGRCGFDLIVKSKSGTGKTLVFSIIALESLKLKQNKLQILVLSPTREIAVQSQEVIKLIGCYYKGLKVHTFIGGLPLSEDQEKCKTCHIAVGTPGRIKQLIIEKTLNAESVHLFVLDEADKLMEQSFRNDINEIYNSLPAKKQIITTSATYPDRLDEFLAKYMLSPTHVTADMDTPLLLGLKQFVVVTKPTSTVVQLMKVKTEELINIITNISFTQCLIFSNYQTRSESLSNILNQKGWPSTYISGAQSQYQRLEAVNNLKDFKCRIMLSTDLTARGIDAANVDLVINYDIPLNASTYLHRMGRAGRYGSTGVCINLACEGSDLSQLQKLLGHIGGTALSVPKLPKFNGTISELVKLEVSTEEHIYGTANIEQSEQDTVKIFEIMKEEKKQDKNVEILNILKGSTSEEEEIKKQISDMDTDSILNSLINQNFKIESTGNEQSQELDTNAILKSLTEVPNDGFNKINKSVKTLPSDIDFKEQDKDKLFIKNRALLNVSKILSGSSNADDLVSVEKHLSLLKSEDNCQISSFKDKDASDLLNMLLCQNKELEENTDGQKQEYSQTVSEEETSDKDSEDNETRSEFNIEEIFKFGYEKIVKSNKKSWRNFLHEITQTYGVNFEKQVVEEEENHFSDKDGMEYETYSESDSNAEISEVKKTISRKKHSVNNEKQKDSAEVEIMKWVPVETSGKTSNIGRSFVVESEATCDESESLSQYFEECSNDLWQNGLSFDSPESFDEWFFYEWEAQLSSVRNYVQQNIYINEMAKYQNYRRGNENS